MDTTTCAKCNNEFDPTVHEVCPSCGSGDRFIQIHETAHFDDEGVIVRLYDRIRWRRFRLMILLAIIGGLGGHFIINTSLGIIVSSIITLINIYTSMYLPWKETSVGKISKF